MEFAIRIADIKDLNNMKQLEKSCFDEHIRENFEYVLSSSSHVYFVCEKVEENNKTIVGYAGASISYDEGDILSVCTLSDYRKRSIAFVLMDTLIEYVKEKGVKNLFLEVSEDNIPAIKLYNKLGFTLISERKNYYGTKTALIMKKIL